MERLNHLAVLVAGVVFFVLGWLWYTVFRGPWMADNAITSMNPQPYILAATFIISIAIAYAIAMAIGRAPRELGAADGVQFGLFTGIGFVALSMLLDFINEGRPIRLWFIDAGFIVLGFVVMGAIIAGWKKTVPTSG
jgi:hypothetical protein